MKRLGKQKPRFSFFLNPYGDVRFTRCPKCTGKTKQRKLPLLIHVDPMQLIALNKTCRYCPSCDLLIAHKDQIEDFLMAFLSQKEPDVTAMTTWSSAPWTAQIGRRGSSPPSLPTTCWNNCTTSRKCSCSSQQEVGIRTRTCKRSRLAEDLVAADSSPEDRGVAGDGLSVVKVLVASLGNLAIGEVGQCESASVREEASHFGHNNPLPFHEWVHRVAEAIAEKGEGEQRRPKNQRW
jgi:hypothetical protein